MSRSTKRAKRAAERKLIRALLEAVPSKSGIPAKKWEEKPTCNCWACKCVRGYRVVA